MLPGGVLLRQPSLINLRGLRITTGHTGLRRNPNRSGILCDCSSTAGTLQRGMRKAALLGFRCGHIVAFVTSCTLIDRGSGLLHRLLCGLRIAFRLRTQTFGHITALLPRPSNAFFIGALLCGCAPFGRVAICQARQAEFCAVQLIENTTHKRAML
ncbi:hypothetical protein [Roseinatronobacter sp. NSM]|uniref:hypothetical protein n=1 Tax=Roseinatronobacter sp. NSM TaxID=3457785 RepID=UPI004036A22A